MPVWGKEVYARLKVPALDDFRPRAVKGIFLGMTERVANGKAVMYTDTGYIDINAALYEAVGDLSVERLPADWQPEQPPVQADREEEQAQAAQQQGEGRQAAHPPDEQAGSFEDDGRVASWMCPACRGRHAQTSQQSPWTMSSSNQSRATCAETTADKITGGGSN